MPQQKAIQMANKHIKTCSISSVIKEMQIKTMRYRYTPTKMAKIQKLDNSNCWGECRAIEILIHC